MPSEAVSQRSNSCRTEGIRTGRAAQLGNSECPKRVSLRRRLATQQQGSDAAGSPKSGRTPVRQKFLNYGHVTRTAIRVKLSLGDLLKNLIKLPNVSGYARIFRFLWRVGTSAVAGVDVRLVPAFYGSKLPDGNLRRLQDLMPPRPDGPYP